MFENLRQNIHQYVHLTDLEFQEFTDKLVIRKLKKRQTFVREGEVCRYVGYIEDGLFRCLSMTDDGQERVEHFGVTGEWMSEYPSFPTQTPARQTIEALRESTVFLLSYDNLQLLFENPKVERLVRKLNESMSSENRLLINEIRHAAPEDRYRIFMQKRPDLIEQVPQYYIANYLGMTPVSLSRIRRRMLTTSF
jgi:CRP-like cAMP-binding protein